MRQMKLFDILRGLCQCCGEKCSCLLTNSPQRQSLIKEASEDNRQASLGVGTGAPSTTSAGGLLGASRTEANREEKPPTRFDSAPWNTEGLFDGSVPPTVVQNEVDSAAAARQPDAESVNASQMKTDDDSSNAEGPFDDSARPTAAQHADGAAARVPRDSGEAGPADMDLEPACAMWFNDAYAQ